jgi:hypothetical protein
MDAHTGLHKWHFEGPYQYHDSMGWVAHGRLDCLPDTCLEELIVLVTMQAHLSHVFSTWVHALRGICCRLLNQLLAASHVKNRNFGPTTDHGVDICPPIQHHTQSVEDAISSCFYLDIPHTSCICARYKMALSPGSLEDSYDLDFSSWQVNRVAPDQQPKTTSITLE